MSSSPAARRAITSPLNATTGAALWQARLNASVANGPITYELDGQEYVLVGAGDTLWAFVLNEKK